MDSSDGHRRPLAKITDVAALAGVAPMTVSRVLNQPERVGAATAERVRAAIAQLGYVPNLLAGGLSSRRSRTIAAIVPTIATPVFSAAIQSFTARMGDHGYHVLLGLSDAAPDGEAGLVAAILGRRPDGLLLTGTAHDAATRGRIAAAGVPTVEIWDAAEQPMDMLVGFDHREVGAAIADFFLRKGHRRFAAIAADDGRSQARCAGFQDAARAGGGAIVGTCVFPPSTSAQDGRAAVRQMLPALRGGAALMCSSDLSAFGAVVEAAAQTLRVPDQLAVCGFGDLEVARAMEPAITTVNVDGAVIGRLAADCLLDRFAGRSRPARTTVPFRIVERAST